MHSPGKFLCAVGFIEKIVSQRLQVGKVRAILIWSTRSLIPFERRMLLEKCTPQSAKVGVLRVVHLGDTPGVNSSSNKLSVNLNLFF